MEDHVNVLNCPADGRGIAHVACHQFHFGREIVRRSIAMYLRREAVKDANLVSGLNQGIGQVRTNESSTTCDQNFLSAHLAPIRYLVTGSDAYAASALSACFAGA